MKEMVVSYCWVFSYMMLFLLKISMCEECDQRPVYYVSNNTGTDSKDCLKPGLRDHPCASLAYLINHIHQCATMKLLDDQFFNHSVIYFSPNLANITVVGSMSMTDKPVTITCEGNSGMVIKSPGTYLQNIHFSACSFDASTYRTQPSKYDIISNFTMLYINKCTDVHIVYCSFDSHHGSAILLENNQNNVSIEHSIFHGNEHSLSNEQHHSGGIVIRSSEICRIREFHLFWYHSGCDVSIVFCQFMSNVNRNINATSCSTTRSLLQSQHQYGGALDVSVESKFRLTIESCSFESNTAINGGAVNIVSNDFAMVTITDSNFTQNSAMCQGGALSIVCDHCISNSSNLIEIFVTQSQFDSNTAYWGGALGAIIYSSDYSNKTAYFNFSGTSWTSNKADASGFAIFLRGPGGQQYTGITNLLLNVSFFGSTNISRNEHRAGGVGAIMAEYSRIIFGDDSSSKVDRNVGSAISLINSQMFLYGKLDIYDNSGSFGGAVYLEGDASILFGKSSETTFFYNTATIQGGAIYAKGTNFCALNSDRNSNPQVSFVFNLVGLIEQSIYFESTGQCTNTAEDYSSVYYFFPSGDTQVLFPLHKVDLNFEPSSKRVMLGESFYLKPTELLDIYDRPSVGIGYLTFNAINASYSMRGPSAISLDSYTGSLEFQIEGPEVNNEREVFIYLYFQRQSSGGIGKVTVNFTLAECGLGYSYCNSSSKCICKAQSDKQLIRCTSTGQNLCIKRHYWFSNTFNKAYSCPAQNCLFQYGGCPKNISGCSNSTEYCGLQAEDDVCWPGRSGFLCSKCAKDYSFTFAAFMCRSSKSCNTKSTFLLLLALVFYWIIFIAFLMITLSLNLSVGSGLMVGIVYFFSVAKIYTKSNELFSDMWIRIVMYIDMAITLCDPELLGYITNLCFARSWTNPLPHLLFSYTTPLFLILAIVLLIVVSRYCRLPRRLSLSENSPIHAICLLILLSYTSISCTSLKLLIPMEVNGDLRVEVAPTVPYFGSEHTPYAIVAILAELFLSLPVCFLFLFAPVISKRVNLVKFRLKPVVDEFQACYKPQHRWYAGFYFLTRQVIYLTNGLYMGPFPQLNYVLTTINILILITHCIIQPYSKAWLNILDTILLTDIVILSLSSPVKVEVTGMYKFFYDTVIPYGLVFFPTAYLFGALCWILWKKLLAMFPSCQRFAKINYFGKTLNRTTSNEIREDLFSSSRSDSSSAVCREPLLDDSYMSSHNSSQYGSTRNRNSTSMRTTHEFPSTR